ncbi:hypothetical protein [Flavitalea antarctica]
MIVQHLLLFVFLAFLIGRKPKPNYRTRSRNYDAAYRRPAERMLGSDTLFIADTLFLVKPGLTHPALNKIQ